MANYVVTTYATAPLAETAIEALETTVKFDIIAYRDGSKSKFMMITPSPNATA